MNSDTCYDQFCTREYIFMKTIVWKLQAFYAPFPFLYKQFKYKLRVNDCIENNVYRLKVRWIIRIKIFTNILYKVIKYEHVQKKNFQK